MLAGCKKNEVGCSSSLTGKFGFTIYEAVLDSIFATDTSFANREIVFKTNGHYSNILWKIGDDPRSFVSPRIALKFLNPENITVQLRAVGSNKTCDIEEFFSTSGITLLPSDGSIKSPMVGSYRGYNVDNPQDTFTVSIKFWHGARYPWWSDGAYSVENLPRGYSDTTKEINGIRVPEIKGIVATAGYKNIAIDQSGNYPASGIKGYGNLRRGGSDTLYFSYSLMDTLRLVQTGQFSYIKKEFLGIKE